MNFSARLKAWRGADAGRDGRGHFSQEEAAAHLGIPLRTYQGYEQGAREPRGLALELLTLRMLMPRGGGYCGVAASAPKGLIKKLLAKKEKSGRDSRKSKPRTQTTRASARRPARRTGRKSKHHEKKTGKAKG